MNSTRKRRGKPLHGVAGMGRREYLRNLNTQFQDSKRCMSVSPCRALSQDIASVTQVRQTGGPEGTLPADAFQWALPFNRQKMFAEFAMAQQNRYHWRINREDREEYAALVRDSDQNRELQSELAAYRQFEITSDIQALPFALGAFQSINLSEDELPMMITPAARQYFAVRWIGQDGGARQDQWRSSRSAETLEINFLSTDKVEYTLFDLQQGNLNEVEQVNNQLRFDMGMKIEDLAKTSMDNNVYPSGLRSIMQIHPSIDPANIPDSNYLDLTDTGTYGPAHVFTLARLKAVLHHMAMWGFGFSPDGPATLQTMLMSPLNARDSWDYVDLVSGWDSAGETWDASRVGPGGFANPANTVPTGVREQIFNTGALMNSAWGYSWQTQFNPRLSTGRLYVMTNQPIGWFFTKTGFDRFIEWRDGPDNIEQNYGQSVFRRALSFHMPELWAYRFLIVDF